MINSTMGFAFLIILCFYALAFALLVLAIVALFLAIKALRIYIQKNS